MAPVKSLTTELELRSDERGKWSVWFKGERIPGIVKINGDWENGTRAEITLTFVGAAVGLASDLPSGVFYRAEYDALVDEGGNVLETALRWYARRDEFPPYVPKIPDGIFYVPELMMFFRTSNFGTMSPEFNAEWIERKTEFPQKNLVDAVKETFEHVSGTKIGATFPGICDPENDTPRGVVQNRKDDPTFICDLEQREITIIP